MSRRLLFCESRIRRNSRAPRQRSDRPPNGYAKCARIGDRAGAPAAPCFRRSLVRLQSCRACARTEVHSACAPIVTPGSCANLLEFVPTGGRGPQPDSLRRDAGLRGQIGRHGSATAPLAPLGVDDVRHGRQPASRQSVRLGRF